MLIKEDLPYNFVAKYCINIFWLSENIQNHHNFKSFYWNYMGKEEERDGYFSERNNIVQQCIEAIEFAHNHSQDDFALENIQYFYEVLYNHTYDYDWKIHNSMRKCNLTMPWEQMIEINSVESISQMLR